ncbi:MAG: hypothetical protein FJ128_05520, partial [Deltaproteobacteria bacterium]|nr:hypothetical protein [Deltaproteobacteria bacterium]
MPFADAGGAPDRASWGKGEDGGRGRAGAAGVSEERGVIDPRRIAAGFQSVRREIVNARIRRFLGRDGGAVLPLTAVFLVVALGVMALAIDLGRVFLVKSELQRAADAAALAGALGLVTPPGGLPGLTTMSPNCGRATALAQAVFTSNHADGLLLSMVNGTISLGIWNSGTGVFTDTGCAVPALVNAVQAVAQKTISLYFGGIITGSPTMPLSAQALVLVGSVGSVPP